MRTLVALVLLFSLLPAIAAQPAPAAPSHVVVYYFHGDQRCRTCLKIESSTEQALHARFAKQLKENLVEWRVLNFDRPENEHVIKDYGLVSQSVVLVEYRDGKEVRFKNLDKVWHFISDAQAFETYIRTELDTFLKNAHA